MQMGKLIIVLIGLVSCGLSLGDESTADSPVGRRIGEFVLRDFRGKEHRFSDYAEHKVVVVAFLGTECPLAKLYGPRLQALADAYTDRGVVVLGINSNQQDSLAEIAAFCQRHVTTFPMLKDPGNVVSDQFGATRTPEVFVLDQSRAIRYFGRVDDQYGVGYGREKPERQDVRAAIDELLAGRPVTIPSAPAVGCLIGRAREPNESSLVTYTNQIARLLQRHCVECHREGEIAPFALTSYDEAAPWADMIQEVVESHRMPPWHANPEYGDFSNARGMSPEEKELLYQWVRQGAPEGDRADLPAPREFTTGWRLPKVPDRVINMRSTPFTVPAEGVVEYQYFAVDPQFTEETWVAAADIVPGSRSAVHHVIVFISPPEDQRQRGVGLLAAYVPGQSAYEYSPGRARLIPAGSKLIFQMHYTPIGVEHQDMSRLGLVYADPGTVTEEVVSLIAVNKKFEIPPHAADHAVEASRSRWPVGAKLLSLAPHMHLRGKSFRVKGTWPDGHSDIILDVPHYDFNWQSGYRLAEPLPLDQEFVMHCIGRFDNSVNNLSNPDPEQAVRWGDQTWDEMMIAFFDVAVPRDSLPKAAKREAPEITVAQRAAARRKAREFLERLDLNGDGRLRRKESPRSLATFAFRQFDANRDGSITEDEVYDEALRDILHQDR